MRVITGQFKNRQLKAPEGIRPTEDRIRKSLFDIIDPENADFLELFAGSGSVGFEALSQGAASVTFVEKERSCVRIIEENARNLAVSVGQAGEGKVEVMASGAEEAVTYLHRQGRKFDMIFLDPPYYKGLSEKILQSLGEYDILHHSGVVIIQHYRKDTLSESSGELVSYRQARYGDSLLSFYRKRQQNVQESNLPGNV